MKKILPKNKIINKDCFDEMGNWPFSTIDFVMFSPPYDANKEYEERMGREKYKELILRLLYYLRHRMKEDGRICIVVPFRCGVKSGRWSRLNVVFSAMDDVGLNIRDLIIWNQKDIQGTAWGSFKSASAPNIQYQTEYIVIGYKNQWKKMNKGTSTITSEEFKQWTISNIWDITPDTKNPHPAPYPVNLSDRCIKLFTYKEDIVLDPMCGSGTTCVSAKKLGRDYIGIEKEKKYCDIARKRLSQSYLYEYGVEK